MGNPDNKTFYHCLDLAVIRGEFLLGNWPSCKDQASLFLSLLFEIYMLFVFFFHACMQGHNLVSKGWGIQDPVKRKVWRGRGAVPSWYLKRDLLQTPLKPWFSTQEQSSSQGCTKTDMTKSKIKSRRQTLSLLNKISSTKVERQGSCVNVQGVEVKGGGGGGCVQVGPT